MGRKWTSSGASSGRVQFHKEIEEGCNNQAKGTSSSQKEKQKRDLGQSSKGKKYVKEKKRLLKDQGVYSRFDT
jgi:hypothetical protein